MFERIRLYKERRLRNKLLNNMFNSNIFKNGVKDILKEYKSLLETMDADKNKLSKINNINFHLKLLEEGNNKKS